MADEHSLTVHSGIDVQAELQLKAGHPTFTSPIIHGLAGQSMQASRAQLQRAAVQRHHARRSASTIASSYVAQQGTPAGTQTAMVSPQAAPTPSSHISSPSDPSTGSPSVMQSASGMPSPANHPLRPVTQHRQELHHMTPQGIIAQQPLAPRQATLDLGGQAVAAAQRKASGLYQEPARQSRQQPMRSVPRTDQPDLQLFTPPAIHATHDANPSSMAQSASAYYPSPFQKHIDQLGKFLPYFPHRTMFVLD